MATLEKMPWRCAPCRRLVKASQLYCPSCGGWWEETVDPHYVHQDRTAQRWESSWQWTDGAREAPRSPRKRSSSVRGRSNRQTQGKDRSKGSKGGGKQDAKGKDAKGAPSPFGPASYLQSGSATPWPLMDFSPFQPPAAGSQLTTSTTSGATTAATTAGAQELVQALKKAYQDVSTMPSNVREVLEKVEASDARQVTKDLHAATTALGKARKSHQEAAESKRLLRTSWLKHLEESAKAWEAQLEHFRKHMASLQDQEARALQAVAVAQKTIQQLNAQGGKDQVQDEQLAPETMDSAAMDVEEETLRKRVQQTMKTCLGALGVEVQEISDEEKDKDGENPSKRARSADPPKTGTTPTS